MKTNVEEAILVIPREKIDQLDEALALAETAGYKIIRVYKTRYRNRLGKGLIYMISDEVPETVTTIIFYGNPSPSSIFQLMKKSRKRVIDRVQLILEIFAKHAGSREAQLQIEAARIKHEIPIVREWIRRSKMGELPGFLGPGRYAIDAYYRHLTSKLARIRRELEKQRRIRSVRRGSREKKGFVHVSIVGYASAGKTSLFNVLTGESKPVGREYFTTLHTKHKRVNYNGVDYIFVDTVGFIRDIPPEIIESFYSTLEEIVYSDAIIFVIDSSDPLQIIHEKIRSGFDILARIGASGRPVIIALNKIDVADSEIVEKVKNSLPTYIPPTVPEYRVVEISAKKRKGIDQLFLALTDILPVPGRDERTENHSAKARTQAPKR
ncbi:MAG: GTPase HflX [Desulfurococcales archaeon]|nr:GTPase HflX [Desulfurococcales archaeon]